MFTGSYDVPRIYIFSIEVGFTQVDENFQQITFALFAVLNVQYDIPRQILYVKYMYEWQKVGNAFTEKRKKIYQLTKYQIERKK